MSSATQSALNSLQKNNYLSVAMLIAVVYDYVLTFSDEIEYIWMKPWTGVSTMFILVRYAGLCAMTIVCLRTSFLPGPIKTSVFAYPHFVSTLIQSSPYPLYPRMLSKGEAIWIIGEWTYTLFLAAADVAMILRVWAMYNRSKLILRTLLTFFALEIVSTLLADSIFQDSRYMQTKTVQILDFSYCVWQNNLPSLMKVVSILQMTHAAAMCILAIAQFVRQSLQMHFVTKGWQLNRYINLLVRQGILYFLGIFLYNFVVVFNYSGGGWQGYLLYILAYVPMYTLTPRFILSIRELYARDVRGRGGEGIDTGFGLLSAGRGADMVFADIELNEGLEEDVQGGRGDGNDTGTGLGSSSFSRGSIGPVISLADA
ncbi:hypothetical protein OG21DRAFT_1486466 [Imleria badia]|nr:hypothetical protein OG21DRAFT_1486466 [Imleria badia]